MATSDKPTSASPGALYRTEKENTMTIYINGRKASQKDLTRLIERCKRGLEVLAGAHLTRSGNLAILTV